MGDTEGESDPGLGNMMLGYLLLGLQPLPVVLLKNAGVGAAETVFARFALGLIFIGMICLFRGRGLSTLQPKILLLRGVLGGFAVLLYFFSIQNAGAARGTLLNYTYPIWANLFSFFLGRRPPASFWWGLGVALLGLYLVVAPAGGWGGHPLGLGEASGLASAVLAGAAVLTIKQLRTTDETLTIIAAFSACGCCLSLFLFDTDSWRLMLRADVFGLSLAVGLIAFLGHVFFTRGYRGMNIQHATLLSLTVPVTAAALGVVFLGERFSLRLLVGAALILLSTAVVLTQKSPAS